ncbi:hypothetical protein GCM10020331_004100 [Ectobacillus funiculus]
MLVQFQALQWFWQANIFLNQDEEKAMSLISSAASLGFGLGPVIGGTIIQALGWHYLFVVTALVFVVLPVFSKLLPKRRHASSQV